MSSFRESLTFLELGRGWYLHLVPIVETSEIENGKLHQQCGHYFCQEYALHECTYCVAGLGVLSDVLNPLPGEFGNV